jgi:hypothetical protein
MTVRHSTIFIGITAVNLLLFTALSIHAATRHGQGASGRSSSRALVRDLMLTDLCLSTEARYTRHPAMADTHAAFQEHPTALDHFPSGSLLPPAVPPWRPHAEAR